MCYQPHATLDGICLHPFITKMIEDGQVPNDLITKLNIALVGSHIESHTDDQVRRGFENVIGSSDGLSILTAVLNAMKGTNDEIRSDLRNLQSSLMDRVDVAEKNFANDVQEQCSATSRPEQDAPRRLRVNPAKIQQSQGFQNAKKTAAKYGMGEQQILGFVDKFLDDLSDIEPLQFDGLGETEVVKKMNRRATEVMESEKQTMMDKLTKDLIQSTLDPNSRKLMPAGIAGGCGRFAETLSNFVSQVC